MGYALVPMLLNVAICWVWLQLFYIGIPWRSLFVRNRTHQVDQVDLVREALQAEYENLGSMNFHEIAVLVLFIILVILWFFREPEFIVGWGDFFHTT
jgi:sodium-dependent dicarboxylate transporter 2/3/5